MAGGLIVVLAVGLWLRLGPDRLASIGYASVAVLGLATSAVGALPLDCAVTADAQCHAAEQAGRVSVVHQAHTVVSVIASTAAIVGLATLGCRLRQVCGWRMAGWFGLAAWLPVLGLCLMLGVLGLGFDSVGWVAGLGRYLGLLQRVELLLLAIWIAALAGALLSAGPHSWRAPRPQDPR